MLFRSACDIKRIADVVRDRLDVPGFSRKVSRDLIRKNDYNLNIPRYVDSSEAPEQYDIYATMFGGIPDSEIDQLDQYWKAFPSLRDELFAHVPDTACSELKVDDLAQAIDNNADVAAFKQQFAKAFGSMGAHLHERLIDNVANVKEMAENDHIASDIFQRMNGLPLVDQYAAYQILADHWQGIMGDIEIIQTEGIEACKVVETNYKVVKKDGLDEEVPDGERGRIMPFDLIQQQYFAAELQEIADLRSHLDGIASDLEEWRDTLAEDEDGMAYLDSDKDNALDKKKITADAKPKADVDPGIKGRLQTIVELWNQQSKTKKLVTAMQAELFEKTKDAICNLSEDQIKSLLELKWIRPITDAIDVVPAGVLEELSKAVELLNSKYASTFSNIEESIRDSRAVLSNLIDQLAGDSSAIRGLQGFKNALK